MTAALAHYQFRFIQYAKAHGKTPEDMERDLNHNFADFLSWITLKWSKFDQLHNYQNYPRRSEAVHAQFDDMLERGAI